MEKRGAGQALQRGRSKCERRENRGVNIELLHIEGCPNTSVAEARLRAAVASAGLDGEAAVSGRLIATHTDAESVIFAGSPTFIADGVDLFAGGERTSDLACRVYATDAGLAGVPTEQQLREALLSR